MIISDPEPLPSEVTESIERWTKREGNRLFLFITNGPHPHVILNRFVVLMVREDLRDLDAVNTLDVILDSGGGSIDASYQLITFLRSKCETLRVFVPDYAKSAATFFCLGADEIWMNETAELGPLDAQIPDPKHPERYMSALEQFKAMDYLRTYAFETLDAYVRLMIERTSMSLRDMIGDATRFVSQLMKPLYDQVDPFHFGGSQRELEVVVEYGRRLMPRYAYRDWTEDRVRELLENLTWKYQSHSFMIDYAEAKRLGLRVHLLEGQRDRDAHAIAKGMIACVGLADEKPKQTRRRRTQKGGRAGGSSKKARRQRE